MTGQRADYFSYLLRMWLTGSESNAIWRASLEDPFTGELEGFASLVDLFASLQARINAAHHEAEETTIDGENDDAGQSRRKGGGMD